MKKPYSFKEVSDVKCVDCGKSLKKNLITKNPQATRCYRCHENKKKNLSFLKDPFSVLDALGGAISDDYDLDIVTLNKNGNTTSKEIYWTAAQMNAQP